MNKDWKCSCCRYHNFCDNLQCRKCGNPFTKVQEINQRIDGNKGINMDKPPKFKANDWTCVKCDYRNWEKNLCCRRCQHQK